MGGVGDVGCGGLAEARGGGDGVGGIDGAGCGGPVVVGQQQDQRCQLQPHGAPTVVLRALDRAGLLPIPVRLAEEGTDEGESLDLLI